MHAAELLSPAGDFETALAAFAAGADAVYCGLADFSARAFAKNFSSEDLANLLRYARAKGKRVYVTVNTLIDEDELEGVLTTLSHLEELGPDAIIVQDLGLARLCRAHFPGLALHASTQLVAHNLEGVLALKELGFTRVVLARELSVDEIASIAKRCGGLELECFIHGALCYSVSGLCLFSAMEKGRSGNRGTCAYCCRQEFDGVHPFSMKDLRAGEDVRRLVAAGVVSLKIEGRMKSALYVSSVTKYYRDLLDGAPGSITTTDLETVFSRRTTKLYLAGQPTEPVIDTGSLGHVGTRIGTVKRITKDREGRSWLRFHTQRPLERHDGLQFDTMVDGRHLGMGIADLRGAISRASVFEVAAGADVEVALPDELAHELKIGEGIYCSMSNAVKRRFPTPSFRSSDYAGTQKIDVEVTLAPEGLTANGVHLAAKLEPAKSPEKTFEGVRKAFAKLGGTNYCLGRLTVNDNHHLFAPPALLNDLRRLLLEDTENRREAARQAKLDAALADAPESPTTPEKPVRRIKVRVGQKIPAGDWAEIIVAITDATEATDLAAIDHARVRLALPVYTREPDFGKLRQAVRRLVRAGFARWEAADLATLRLLKQCDITDITADWTLYAFNSSALALLSAQGVTRFVASPENGRENLQYLAESGYAVEFLAQQSTPLFISLTQPAEQHELAVAHRGPLWVTTKPVPRTFTPPEGVATRYDLSWDPT